MESETNLRKPCLIYKNNKFSRKYVGKTLTTWKCTIRGCNASIRTDNFNNIVDQPLTHTHGDKIENIAAYKLNVACKRKGLDVFETPPCKVVRQTLQALGDENNTITTLDLYAEKRGLWRNRIKQHGAYPASALDCLDKIKLIPLSTSRKEDFLMSCHEMSKTRAMIFSHAKQIFRHCVTVTSFSVMGHFT